MARTLLGGIRLAFLAVANGLVNKTIDLNSTDAVEQMLRDLKTSLDHLDESLAQAKGASAFSRSEKVKLNSLLAKKNAIIDDSLKGKSTNEHLASSCMAQVIGLESEIKVREDEISSADATVAQLTEARSALQSKLDSMTQRLRILRSEHGAAQAKNQAARALSAAADAGLVANSDSVDGVAEHIEKEDAVATERFNSAMSKFGDPDHDVVASEVEQRLAARKAALNQITKPATATA